MDVARCGTDRRSRLRGALGLVVLFPLALAAQTNLITLAPDGAWTWYNDPRAVFHNGALYYGFVRSDGASTLNVLDLQAGTTRTLWTSTWRQYDDHDEPGLLSLQDGRLLAIYARHGSAQTFSYRLSLTSDPRTPATWGPEQTLAPTGAGLTYANPFQLSAEAGKVYDFSRNLNFNPTVFTSADSGATWSAPTLLIKTGTGSIRPYVKYCSDYSSRIDFLYTDGHPRDINNSLYHAYYQAGSLYQSDGAFLKSFSDIPLLHDYGERGTVIYAYSDSAAADYNDHIPSGRAWCWEIVYQTNGWPASVFTVQRDNVAATDWTGDRIYYYYARWTGTNWQKRFIAQAGRPLYSSEDDYAGGIALDPEDPSTVYLSSDAAVPFDLTTISNVPLAAHYEIYRGVTTDGGLSFNWSQVTSNSTVDNFRPYIPRHRQGVPALIWFRGSYPTFTTFTTSVVGLFTNYFPRVGLQAHWPLDAVNAGIAPDRDGGHDLPAYGSPPAVSGSISNALVFNGSSQYLGMTDSATANWAPLFQPGNLCTISMWVRGGPQTAACLFSESATTNNNPLFLLQTGQFSTSTDKLDILIRTSNGTLVDHFVTVRPVFDNTWHHIAYTDNAGAVQVYVDGNADTNFTYTPGGILGVNSFAIGALIRSNVSAFFNGAIDDVIVWQRALGQGEVQSVMANSIPALPPVIESQSAGSTNAPGESVTFSVVAGGTLPFQYQWRKNGANIVAAANPTALSSALTITNLQLQDAGEYSVVVANSAGAVTSSIVRLAVINYTPVTNGPTLRVDFDLSGASNVQPGFQSMTLASNPGFFSNAVQVTLSPIGSISLAERQRTSGAMVFNSPPALTQASIYNDFIFASSITDGTGLRVLISRLAPNTPYGLTIWSFDPQSSGSRTSDWTETTWGTPVTIRTGYTFNGSILPTADFDDTLGALVTSSAAGELQIQGVRHGGTSYGVFINALQLIANPQLQITAAQPTAYGTFRLLAQAQYPGQTVLFEETSDLSQGAWQPSTNAVLIEAHGPIVIAEFPLKSGAWFYRARSN